MSAWALLDAGRAGDPGLRRRSGPVRWRVASHKPEATSAMVLVVTAGHESSQPPRCARDLGWGPRDAQLCPSTRPAGVRERVGCTQAYTAPRPAECSSAWATMG